MKSSDAVSCPIQALFKDLDWIGDPGAPRLVLTHPLCITGSMFLLGEQLYSSYSALEHNTRFSLHIPLLPISLGHSWQGRPIKSMLLK